MSVSRNDAMKVWGAYFGRDESAYDAFGDPIYKSNYGTTGNHGWEVDHIHPLNPDHGRSGANYFANLQPLFWENNREKDNDIKGDVYGVKFHVHHISDTKDNAIIGRMAVHNGSEWIWPYREPQY